MLDVILENIGRRFNRDWVFRGLDYHFVQGQHYAILGANGSGKSTLLQLILSSLTPSEGKISYQMDNRQLDIERFFSYVSLAAPYQELIEEFTLNELLDFHFSFKRLTSSLNKKKLLSLLALEEDADKEIRHFSSGMKQRTKLVLACCAATPVLLLDEPTANLDVKGIAWYRQLVQQFGDGKLLIICSNQEHEYDFCSHRILVEDYKV